ncbi:MAG TPA: hypothetical protein VFA33_10530 [Bryobacteraceae bacterium]|nr:hypothetical protein [Bryobacteraceae bacterium]
MRFIKNGFTAFLLASGLLLAQGRGGANGPGAGAGLDLTRTQTIEGVISALNLVYGVQYPSMVVNNTEIKLAPAWYFVENDFELAVKDRVRVTAAPCRACGDPALYAIDITITASGDVIVLRSSAGLPLWTRGAGQGSGAAARGAGIDSGSIRTVTGKISSVNAGAGIQMPTLTLAVDGASLSVRIGPERVLLEADFPLHVGDQITARIALATCTGQYVALSLTNAQGTTLVLRNDDGAPVWPR